MLQSTKISREWFSFSIPLLHRVYILLSLMIPLHLHVSPSSEANRDRFYLFLLLYVFGIYGSIAKSYFIFLYKYFFLFWFIEIFQLNTNFSCSSSFVAVKLHEMKKWVSLIYVSDYLPNVTRKNFLAFWKIFYKY